MSIAVGNNPDVAGMGSGRTAIYARNGARWWTFVYTSTSTLTPYYSTDGGSTWTSTTGLTLLHPHNSEGQNLSVEYGLFGTTDVVHITNCYYVSATERHTTHVRATLGASTITWGSETELGSPGGYSSTVTKGHGSTAILANGQVTDIATWLADASGNDNFETAVWPNSETGGTWTPGTPTLAEPYSVNTAIQSGMMFPTGLSGALGLTDDGDADGAPANVIYSTYNGSSWTAGATVFATQVTMDPNDWGAAKRKDWDIHCVRRTGASAFEHRRWNGSSWVNGDTIPSQATATGTGVALVSDGNYVVLVAISSGTGTPLIMSRWSSSSGWGAWANVSSTSVSRVSCSVTQANTRAAGGTALAICSEFVSTGNYNKVFYSITVDPGGGSPSVITLVQSNKTDSASATTSQKGLLPMTSQSGNLLVATLAIDNNATTVTPPSGWSQATYNQPSGANALLAAGIWYRVVTGTDAGATSWTFTTSASHVVQVVIEEWFAPNGWGALDQTANGDTSGAPTTSTTISSGTTATTTSATELEIGVLAYLGASQSESGITAGWTSDLECQASSSVTSTALYHTVTSTGTAHVQYTIGVAKYWAGATATFVATAASGQTFTGEADGRATAVASMAGARFVGEADGVGTAVVSLTPAPPTAATAPKNTPVSARYSVRVMRMSDRSIAGQIETYKRLAIIKRFNATSDWAIEVDADDPMAGYLIQPGFGISVLRTVYSIQTGQAVSNKIEIAGPMTGISRQMANNLLQVHGRDDMLWLTRREAWPSKAVALTYATLATGPTRYYTGAASGTALTDASTAAQNGTLSVSGTTANQTPIVGDTAPSILFASASSGSATAPTTGLPTGNSPMTMSLWVQPTTIQATVFMHYGNTAVNHQDFYLAMDASGHVYAGTTGGDTAVSSTALVANATHMVTGTWDGTTLRCYLDGVQTASATPTAMNIPASGTEFRMSGRSSASFLSGYAQQFGFWPHAMTATEVTGLYTIGSTDYETLIKRTSGLARYYRMDDTDTTCTDYSSQAQNGTYIAPFTQSQPGGIADSNTSVTFGSGGYVSAPTTGLPTGNNAFSIECWFKSTNGSAVQQLIFIGTNVTKEGGSLYLNASGHLAGGLQGSDITDSGSAATDGNWHHGVFTWDGTTGRLYKDGSQVASSATLGPNAMVQPTNMSIGYQQIAASWPFIGSVDEGAVYSAALSASQVSAHYAAGITAFGSAAYDTQTGAGETVLKHYVNVNLGPGALYNRQVKGLAIETDLARGTSITSNARFDQLVKADGTGLLQQLAIQAGGLGYTLAPVNGVLTFSVYQPQDRTASVTFSQALANLLDFTYTFDAPDSESGGNCFVVAGGGQGTDRIFVIEEDDTSIATWGRSEQFQDARDTKDVPTLEQRGIASLASNSAVTTFNCVISPSPQTVYEVDFNLGDKVTAVIDGVAFQEVIREIDITLEGGKAEVVTPILGTPSSNLIRDVLFKYIATVRREVNTLKRLQTTT